MLTYEKFNNNKILTLLELNKVDKPNWTDFNFDLIENKLEFIDKYIIPHINDDDFHVTAKDYVESAINTLNHEKINNVDTVKIYRAITLDNEFKKGLGIYWSPDKNYAIVYHGNFHVDKFIISANCSLNDVDWDFTLGVDHNSYDIPAPIEEWGTSWGEVELRLNKNSIVCVNGYYYNDIFNKIDPIYCLV